jgi:hypothetical protein
MKNITITKLFLFCFSFGIAFTFVPNLSVKAQICTAQNSPTVVEAGFPRGAPVQVYIPTNPPLPNGFSQAQVSALSTAFTNWQNASGANNSGVTFTIVHTPPPAGTFQWLVGHETPTTNLRARAETGTTQTTAAGLTQQVVTVIDPKVNNINALIDVMAHEIGHGMGLGDCSSCSVTDSVMGAGNRRTDYWNGTSGRPTSPTACDTQRLQLSYPYCSPPVNTDYCIWDINTCECSINTGGSGGGVIYPEGSGGCPYGTIPYYWVEYISWDDGETWQQVGTPAFAGCFF